MKRCNSCGQLASQKLTMCPACGSHLVEGIKSIDDYQILKIIHEGKSSLVCKAVKKDGNTPVSLRIFTDQSGVNDDVAKRLETELEELKQLPSEHFVQHFAIKKSQDGYWYRVSEWVEASDWGSIFTSGIIHDPRKMVTLFRNIASVLDLLNKKDHFMPYLILDDILIPRGNAKNLHVKVNYKLSRFLNARATHHGPMLQKLLDCHPDILNERPIDFKSGIWSLGKLFVELLTADHNLKDFSSKIDQLPHLNPQLRVLLKIMLADDPDLRPQTMSHVVSTLSHILDTMPYENKTTSPHTKKVKIFNEVQRLKKTVVFLMTLILATAAFSAMSWLYVNFDKNKKETVLSDFVESYTSSMAFVMVEYWLTESGQSIYNNKVEGTAFLVDADGYILTNRHVACPWLEDTAIFQVYHQYSVLKKIVEFDYKMYLWFEGEKAFKRLPALSNSNETSDAYHLGSSFRSGGEGNLRIAGVPRVSMDTGEMIKAPFKNDFAVLKIDGLPKSLKPLPLDTALDPEKIKRLTPVVILGFPLGNRTQDAYVNTSITRGHVRRTSKEIIQVDSSIYKGNSGGPAIDTRGKVIGIASGVVTDQSSGYLKVSTPLSDFGLILPISRPARFIESIKKGTLKWDGILDFSMESKLEQINALAVDSKFKQAVELSEKFLGKGNSPALLFAAGMMNFCTQNFDQSKKHFRTLTILEKENTTARLMLYIIDWIKTLETVEPTASKIFKMAWYEDDEFLGYLATVLKEKRNMNPEFIDYENRSEKSWRLFIEGLIAEKNNQLAHAQKMFRQSILAASINDYVYYLSFSRLNHIQDEFKPYIEDKTAYNEQIESFRKQAKESRKSAEEYKTVLAALIRGFESEEASHEEKIEIYTQLMELAPENRTIVGRIAFYHAKNNEWQKALDFIDIYFEQPTRETALSLSLSLLKGVILQILDRHKESKQHLTKLLAQTKDSWYRIIIKQLLSKPDEKALTKLAGNQPEKLITLYTALGLWEEGRQNTTLATQHYKEALSSYLDDWNEYDLALGRIIRLRQARN